MQRSYSAVFSKLIENIFKEREVIRKHLINFNTSEDYGTFTKKKKSLIKINK